MCAQAAHAVPRSVATHLARVRRLPTAAATAPTLAMPQTAAAAAHCCLRCSACLPRARRPRARRACARPRATPRCGGSGRLRVSARRSDRGAKARESLASAFAKQRGGAAARGVASASGAAAGCVGAPRTGTRGRRLRAQQKSTRWRREHGSTRRSGRARAPRRPCGTTRAWSAARLCRLSRACFEGACGSSRSPSRTRPSAAFRQFTRAQPAVRNGRLQAAAHHHAGARRRAAAR